MGQKTHPKLFRLITTGEYSSNWYSDKFEYSRLIEEDYIIRKTINDVFNNILVVSKIEIRRNNLNLQQEKGIQIKIYGLIPKSKDLARNLSKYFVTAYTNLNSKALFILNSLKNYVKPFTNLIIRQKIKSLANIFQKKYSKKYFISICFAKSYFENATLITKYISNKIKNRVPFRRVLKQVISKAQLTNIEGIKVQVSGRLNGIEIARSEWKKEGRVPLHTLEANIDYAHDSVETIYGLIGIKVWLFSKNK